MSPFLYWQRLFGIIARVRRDGCVPSCLPFIAHLGAKRQMVAVARLVGGPLMRVRIPSPDSVERNHGMKKMILSIALIAASGCMNLYTRMPGSPEIDRPYQCTREALAMSCIVAFPQMMSPTGSEGLSWLNLVSIPVGLVVAADGCLEAVVDTVCLPYDATR